jgi:hypothetical protein
LDLANIDLKSEHKYFICFYYFGTSTDSNKIKEDQTMGYTSIEHLTSSTVGQTISGLPIPNGDPSSALPADNEHANSLIHFSSSEPKEENWTQEATNVTHPSRHSNMMSSKRQMHYKLLRQMKRSMNARCF